jgi:hypothetical protein
MNELRLLNSSREQQQRGCLQRADLHTQDRLKNEEFQSTERQQGTAPGWHTTNHTMVHGCLQRADLHSIKYTQNGSGVKIISHGSSITRMAPITLQRTVHLRVLTCTDDMIIQIERSTGIIITPHKQGEGTHAAATVAVAAAVGVVLAAAISAHLDHSVPRSALGHF